MAPAGGAHSTQRELFHAARAHGTQLWHPLEESTDGTPRELVHAGSALGTRLTGNSCFVPTGASLVEAAVLLFVLTTDYSGAPVKQGLVAHHAW